MTAAVSLTVEGTQPSQYAVSSTLCPPASSVLCYFFQFRDLENLEVNATNQRANYKWRLDQSQDGVPCYMNHSSVQTQRELVQGEYVSVKFDLQHKGGRRLRVFEWGTEENV